MLLSYNTCTLFEPAEMYMKDTQSDIMAKVREICVDVCTSQDNHTQ